jgi:hypothetical protein
MREKRGSTHKQNNRLYSWCIEKGERRGKEGKEGKGGERRRKEGEIVISFIF